MAGNQKASVLCVEKRFRGKDKAEHAQGWCRKVGEDMAKVDTQVGARFEPVCQTGRKKVMVTKREKERGDKKKKSFANVVGARLDPMAFLKGPCRCPLDHKYLPIRSLRPYFDLLSLHIGMFSNIQPNYHNSTRFG
jgi:hypothetical protein